MTSPPRRASLRLVQHRDLSGNRAVARLDDRGVARRLIGAESTYALAQAALRSGSTLHDVVEALGTAESVDLLAAQAEGRLLPPIDHADPAHLILSGTGLTHLGSAEGRDAMHRDASTEATTDSMRMFRLGLEGGRPAPGAVGVQPEWFYKGDGSCVVPSGRPLVSPSFALDGSEEPEIAGVYLIDDEGRPVRLGFCLANEFSDHVTEGGNYLWLAHSKLRPAALGPELLTGDLPQRVEGLSRVRRDGRVVWEKPFVSGEAAMSHTIANLEQHHFKYAVFRRPGDVHVHFFGTATLSFADGIRTQAGDIFEISAAPFSLALLNPLVLAEPQSVAIGVL